MRMGQNRTEVAKISRFVPTVWPHTDNEQMDAQHWRIQIEHEYTLPQAGIFFYEHVSAKYSATQPPLHVFVTNYNHPCYDFITS